MVKSVSLIIPFKSDHSEKEKLFTLLRGIPNWKVAPNEIIISCETDGGGLLVLSEIYYEPGWKCKVDGKNSKIYQTNHIMRSVYVPDGEHEVIFYYDNSNWKVARYTSRVSFFLAIFLCSFLFYKEIRSNLK